MASYKEPSFKDRAALSAQAKQAALEKLKAKPPILTAEYIFCFNKCLVAIQK